MGFAISFAVLAFAQQTNTPDPQLRQRLVALIQKHADAFNNNDTAALAALFTEDAVLVEGTGPIYGREAIEKHYADLFQNVHFSDLLITVDQDSPHMIGMPKWCGLPEDGVRQSKAKISVLHQSRDSGQSSVTEMIGKFGC